MNRKILLTVLALSFVMLATPLVNAKPWNYPKNNPKFEEFYVEAAISFWDVIFGDHQYIPSFDKVNKLIITVEENMVAYEISVDGNTYTLNNDFTYTGVLTIILYDPVFDTPEKLWTEDFRQMQAIVDYMYDFSAVPGGIDGTLRMRYVANKGTDSINTLAATGDLQNVQIKATAWDTFDPVTFNLNIFHQGIVSGWPE